MLDRSTRVQLSAKLRLDDRFISCFSCGKILELPLNNLNMKKKIYSLLMLTGYLAHAQPINPASTIDLIMPGGAYRNVQNTGAGISQCSFCAQSVVHAYTWDGDNPSIAVYEPGNGTFLQALPMGAMDPDIVIGNDGNNGVVVYELNGDVEYSTFTYSPGAIGLNAPITLVNNAGHPNIDVSSDCDKDITTVIVFDDYTNNDIYFSQGTLLGAFGGTNLVDQLGRTQLAVLTNRKHPDVQVYSLGNYIFTSQGYDPMVFSDCIDVFRPSTGSLNGFSGGNLLLPNLKVHPRIDGVVPNPGLSYAYSVVYKDHDSIRHGLQNQAVSNIQPFGSLSGRPAVAFSGDYHDAIWPSDAVSAPNYDGLGRGFSGGVIDPFFKEVNDVSTTGLFDKDAFSIAGSCENAYAMCWAGDDQIFYKQANAFGNPNYKTEPTKWKRFELFNLAGQCLATGSANDYSSKYGLLPHGLYIEVYYDSNNNEVNRAKVYRY